MVRKFKGAKSSFSPVPVNIGIVSVAGGVKLLHTIKFGLLVLTVLPFLDGIPDLLHHMIVKIQIVKDTEPHTQHLARLKQISDVAL